MFWERDAACPSLTPSPPEHGGGTGVGELPLDARWLLLWNFTTASALQPGRSGPRPGLASTLLRETGSCGHGICLCSRQPAESCRQRWGPRDPSSGSTPPAQTWGGAPQWSSPTAPGEQAWAAQTLGPTCPDAQVRCWDRRSLIPRALRGSPILGLGASLGAQLTNARRANPAPCWPQPWGHWSLPQPRDTGHTPRQGPQGAAGWRGGILAGHRGTRALGRNSMMWVLGHDFLCRETGLGAQGMDR